MSDDLILQLALRAMHDEDALPVMLDAIEETGWDATPAKWLWEDNRDLTWTESPARTWPRSVAAVLLFADWPTSWPLADRCQRCQHRATVSDPTGLTVCANVDCRQVLSPADVHPWWRWWR